MDGRVPDGLLTEIRRRTSLVQLIGNDVVLKPAGHEMRGLCPFHKERTPSFYVIEAKGFWHCFGCGEHGDAIAWVIKTTTLNFRDAALWLACRAGIAEDGPTPQARPIVQRPAAEMLEAKERARIQEARVIWGSRSDPRGTPAERYWHGRKLSLTMPPTIGFVEYLPHPYLWPNSVSYPAMVAAIQAADEDGHKRVRGVHCTYLARPGEPADSKGRALAPAGSPDGRDWKSKIMRGSARGGAVRLTQAEDVMVIGEGIETSASLLQGLYDPDIRCAHIDGEPVGVWAALSQTNMGAVWLPSHVREVILAADGDSKIPDADNPQHHDPEAILLAAATRHRELGRNVRIARPPAGSDFNDLLAAGAPGDADFAEEHAA
jgi:hypothetical protein